MSRRRKLSSVRKRRRTPVRNRAYLESLEAQVITQDIRELGGSATAMTLMAHVEGRYDRRYLTTALKRLARPGGPLKSGRMEHTWGSRGVRYHLREEWAGEPAARSAA